MTIANFLTVSRIVLAPVFFVLIVLCDGAGDYRTFCLVTLWIIYFLIELSDLADGFFARLLKQESELGKILDPFADSLSRLTCFLAFVIAGIMPVWIFIVVLYRDLWVSFIRVLAARKGSTMGARWSGKAKAWIYAVANVVGLITFTAQRGLIFVGLYDIISDICLICFFCVALVALWSGLDYSTVLFNRKK
jgi:CDP-diacylglycerol--glycerol-3-phosphate 3-phosphatidyltransferase